MPSAASFAEVLDQELARLGRGVEADAPSSPGFDIAPAPFAAFRPFDIPFVHRPTAYAASAGLPRPASLTSTSGQAHARIALESASPRPMDFTAAELRAAFRQLAREYHPDRHPDATGAEALQFSRTFTTIASNYRRLARAVASRD